jgi:hypothetical protein
METEVKESAPYDNCIGVVNKLESPGTLADFLEIEEGTEQNDKEWKKHWVGMPEFTQEDNPPYKKIYVNFRNEEDYEAFAKLIDQNLSEKTKSIWYPKLDREENALLRWIEE